MRHRLILSLFVPLACASAAIAQTAAPAPAEAPRQSAPPAAEPANAPPPSRKTFGDWTVICNPQPGQCEADIVLQPEGQLPPVARLAFVRDSADKPTRLVAIVQANLTLQPGPEVIVDAGKANLSFSSCLNSACLADVLLTPEQLAAFRAAGRNGMMTITNAGGEQLSTAISSKGLAEALDALSPKAGQ